MTELIRAHRQKGPSGRPLNILTAAIDEIRKEASADKDALAELLQQQAWAMRRAALFEEAENTFVKALEIKRTLHGANSDKLVSVINGLAGVQRVRGRYVAAEKSYKRVIALLRAAPTGPSANLAIVLDNLAVLYLNMGRTEDAEPVQKEALDIAELKLGLEHPTVAQVVANLATLYENQNRYSEAEQLFERALRIWEGRIPANDRRFGITYDNLAGTYREQGKLQLARETFAKALANIQANYPPGHPEVSVALNNTGLAELALGNIAKGRELIEQSMRLTERKLGKDHISFAVSLSNLADAMKANGELDEARVAYKRALKIIATTLGANHKRALFPLRELGRLEYGQKNYATAAEYFRRALDIETILITRSDGDSGLAHRGIIPWLLRALWRAAQEKQIPEAEAVKEAHAAAQWANLTQAGSAITQLGARLATTDDALADLVRARQDLNEEWQRIDAKLFAAVSGASAQRDAGAEKQLRARLVDIRKEADQLSANLDQRFPDYAGLVTAKPLGDDGIVKLLSRERQEMLLFFSVKQNWTDLWLVDPLRKMSTIWQRIPIKQSKLKSLVHALRCGLDGGEWVGELKPIRCLQATGQMPNNGRLPFQSAVAHELFEVLLGRYRERLKNRHLIFVVDDVLAGLPFQVLLQDKPAAAEDGDAQYAEANFLGLSNPISVLPTVASLRTLRRDARASKASKTYFGVGNPLLTGAAGTDKTAFAKVQCRVPDRRDGLKIAAFDQASAVRAAQGVAGARSADLPLVERVRRLAPLPETADELCRVASTIGTHATQVVLGQAASEARLKQLNDARALASYRVLHFATHGLVAGELAGLQEAALVMTPPERETPYDDGLLMASEVAGLHLDADWVVLSACNTAAAETAGGEALSGLARAFFFAGARSLLVSHWPVQSDAAVVLTTKALAEMQQDSSVGRAEALRRAVVSLVRSGAADASHPQVWAPFVVVGDGGPLGGLGSVRITNPPVVAPLAAAPIAGSAGSNSQVGFPRVRSGGGPESAFQPNQAPGDKSTDVSVLTDESGGPDGARDGLIKLPQRNPVIDRSAKVEPSRSQGRRNRARSSRPAGQRRRRQQRQEQVEDINRWTKQFWREQL
ncbi:MAG: CHAT domain-containing tetratricopeptide repeat protein [Pseudomonadota bacterium]